MSTKKYRLYLVMFAIILTIVGAISIYYFTKEEDKYNGGLLVQKEYTIEEAEV